MSRVIVYKKNAVTISQLTSALIKIVDTSDNVFVHDQPSLILVPNSKISHRAVREATPKSGTKIFVQQKYIPLFEACLLYTSDAADER